MADGIVDDRARQNVAASQPTNVPTWESHGGAKGCQPIVEGELAEMVLVVTFGGDVVRMRFDEAWERNENRHEGDDVWTIGACS